MGYWFTEIGFFSFPGKPGGAPGNWRLQGSLALAACALHNPGRDPLRAGRGEGCWGGAPSILVEAHGCPPPTATVGGAQVSSVSTCDPTWERWGLTVPGD